MPESGHAARHQIGQYLRDNPLDDQSERNTEEAADQTEKQRMPQVEPNHLVGAQADAAQCGDGVDAARQPCPHRLGDADASNEQREQSNQPEESLDAPQAAAQRRLCLDVGLDAVKPGGRESLLDLVRDGLDFVGPEIGWKLEQLLVDDAATEADQIRALEALRREKDPRAEREGATDPIRLGEHGAGDLEPLATEQQLVADGETQPL